MHPSLPRRLSSSRHATWEAALLRALEGTKLQPQSRPITLDASERDRRVLLAVDVLLEQLLPQQGPETVHPRSLAALRRARWALAGVASPACSSEVYRRFLRGYATSSRRSSFDVEDALDPDDVRRQEFTLGSPPRRLTSSSGDAREGSGGPGTTAADPVDTPRALLAESLEAFSEAKVLRVPLTVAHYISLVSFPKLAQWEETAPEWLVEDYCAPKVQRPAPIELAEAADMKSLRVAAAASYASANMLRRARALIAENEELLPAVVDEVAASHRLGWTRALRLAAMLEKELEVHEEGDRPPNALPAMPQFSGPLSSSISASKPSPNVVLACVVACDHAQRQRECSQLFTRWLPLVEQCVASLAAVEPSSPAQSPEEVNNSGVSEGTPSRRLASAPFSTVHRMLVAMSRLCSPSDHWRDALRLYLLFESKVGGDGVSELVGRFMHVLLLAGQWRECLELYDRATPFARAKHPSAYHYYLQAEAMRLEANHVPGSAARLQELFEKCATRNAHTDVAFLRAAFTLRHERRGSLWELCLSAACRTSTLKFDHTRLAEDTLLYLGLAGLWEQAADAVLKRKLDYQRSRYAVLIALAVSEQQGRDPVSAQLLRLLTSDATASWKQLALGAALILACRKPESRVLSEVATRLRGGGAAGLAPLIRRQEEYDAFAAEFLAFLSSCIQHRSKALTAGALAEVCQRGHNMEFGPKHVLGNVIRLLEVPPQSDSCAASKLLSSDYHHRQDAHAGSLTIRWQSALCLLSLTATGGTATRGAEREEERSPSWSTARVPSALMEHGFHQCAVLACF